MLYKRTEYFRYTFGEPVEAEFRILLAAGEGQQSKLGECKLVDLSPGGAKLFSAFNIPVDGDDVRLYLKFIIHDFPIGVYGVILWKKPFGNGFMYGFEFDEDTEVGQLIIGELKLRRRSEIDSGK